MLASKPPHPPANANADWLGKHINQLRTKVHMLDDRAVVLVRFYRGAAANGGLLPIEKNSQPKTKMYHLPLTNDGCKFEWVQAKSALCNVQMTKMQRLDPRYARI